MQAESFITGSSFLGEQVSYRTMMNYQRPCDKPNALFALSGSVAKRPQ